MSLAGKKTEALRAAMAAALVNGKTVYYGDPEGSLAIVPWSEWERVCAVAKLEQLEQCDPNGTWYDVAQAALKRVKDLEHDLARAEAGCSSPKPCPCCKRADGFRDERDALLSRKPTPQAFTTA